MESPHLSRLMRLCRLLAAADGLTVFQLRSKLRTSRRTVFRDFRTLQQMGINVHLFEHQYRLRLKLADCKRRLADAQIRALNKLLDSCLK